MSKVKNLGLNRLNDEDYINAVNELIPDIVNVVKERPDHIALEWHKRMLEVGKTKTPKELIRAYKKSKDINQRTDAYSMIVGFNPEERLTLYQEKLGKMYDDVIQYYIDHECPESIFNTGMYNNKRADFINMMTNKTRTGYDLNRLVKFYFNILENDY